MIKMVFAILALFISIPVAAAGSERPEISVIVVAPPEPLAPGRPAALAVDLFIPKPYHINSDRPLQDYLIPTTLEFEPKAGVLPGRAVFPLPIMKRFVFSDTPLAVFEGTIRITAEINASPELAGKEIVLKGKVRYQACDDQTCFPPASQPFSVTISVKGSADSLPASETAGQRQDGKSIPAAPQIPLEASFAGSPDFAHLGIPGLFFLVFLGGLALNLTPCVYPMIPITISYFGGQAQGKKGSVFLHAFLYVIGMAVTYSALGVVASMTGSLFGGAHQYPAVLIGIALVMVLLALSMFELYELRLPAALNRLAGSSHKGFGGTFLMGLTVGIIAAPCVGPFVLGLLTYVGNRGNAVLGFTLFFVLAMGLGLPFLVLSAFSGSIRRLPRSGAWMVWVRKIFGFILLAMAVFFVKTLFHSTAAYQLTLALVLFLAGIHLAWVDPAPYSGRAFPIVRNMVGILFFAAALYSAVTGLEAGIREARDRSGITSSSVSIQWFPYSEEMLDLASRDGKPVFIDFYADWCAPCKELDKHTFSAQEVVRLSKEFVMLKVDLTDAGGPQVEALRRKYAVRGVPTLVFLTSDGREMAGLRSTGFEPEEIFIRKMKQALQDNAGKQRLM